MPVDPPPLADMEEPLALFDEPRDEPRRRALPAGSFSGLHVKDARDSLVAELKVELAKLSAEDRATIETNLTLIHSAIDEMNEALEEEPDNVFLQERLLRTYREELVLLRRVGGLTRNVMLRNDI